MSPSTREINGPRPAPLKIHKDSHQIQKLPASAVPPPSHHHPVIIYTHSPKVIHTQARDFMALVQKLTGFSRSPSAGDQHQKPEEKHQEEDPEADANAELGFDAGALGTDAGFLSEIPQFATHPSDRFFCDSPKNLYRI